MKYPCLDSPIRLAKLLAIPAVVLKVSGLDETLHEHLRGQSVELLDVIGKIALVGKADLIRNLTDGKLTRPQ